MASNSHRKSGSSARSTGRKRVVIGAEETVRVRYKRNEPEVESERRRGSSSRERTPRAAKGPGARLANVKRDEREQRQRALARRRALAAAAGVVIVIAAVWALIALWRAPIFSVESIKVVGAKRLTPAQVIARAQVPADATLVRLSKRDIVDRLLADPWIAEARVDRDFPSTVDIEIVERVPVATIDAGGTRIWLIDGSGVWLAKRSAEETDSLPVVRDVDKLSPQAGARTESPELLNALAIIGGLSPELLAKVRTLSAPTVDRTALVLPRGVQVIVGSAEDIEKKDQVARAILSENKNVVSVNVRVVNRPTWRGLDSGD